MPGFDRDQVAIDNTVENRRLGSVLLTVGWILLWMDAILGDLLLHQPARWFVVLADMAGAFEGVVGLGAGDHGDPLSPAVGATRLGQRDLQRTLDASSGGKRQKRNSVADR